MIGAKGGSGTRAISKIVQHLGYNLGSNFNESSDSMDMVDFILKWHGPIQDLWFHNELEYLNASNFTKDWELTLNKHMGPNVPKLWGWKNPQSINMLPMFFALYHGLKFIHVVRDGRDIAFSKNQQELEPTERGTGKFRWNQFLNTQPLPIASILYWQKINLEAFNFASKYLGDNYYILKFEDLCSSPINEITKICSFLNLDPTQFDLDKISKEVHTPSSIGRYKIHSPKVISQLERIGEEGLKQFNYI